MLRATTACTFSRSELPKVVRTPSVFNILTSKCASRHNGVHFFHISTSKSRPRLRCFVHFDFEMCFAPQRRAEYLRMLLWHVLRHTRANTMPPELAQCRKCHACHAECRSMSPSAMPATQSEGPSCHQVARLLRQQPRRQRRQLGTKRAARASQLSATPARRSARPCRQVPRLPRKVKVDVAKCHACHANSRGDNDVNWEPTAPPEPAQCHKCHACHAK